jgi:hypothetical protein
MVSVDMFISSLLHNLDSYTLVYRKKARKSMLPRLSIRLIT